MSEAAPRLLFVPVSGASGMGEYARAAAIAGGAQARWPGAVIHFILSREAPYAAAAPFTHTLLPSSPTFHSTEVIEVMQRLRPDLVIFDNAGRTVQLRAAKVLGARVVYVSARRRQRSKAFRFRWMRLIDEHWIAYPRFIAGELRMLERLKLEWMRRPTVRYLDVVLSRRGSLGAERPAVQARLNCSAGEYVLVVPGGGTGHPGARGAAAEFLRVARELARAGYVTVFVGAAEGVPAECEGRAHESRLRMPGTLSQTDLADLMFGAQLIVANGGSTLLQAVACGAACVAAPIAGDQAERIRRCVGAGVTVAVPLDGPAMYRAAVSLLEHPAGLAALRGRARALGLADGIDVALRAMTALLAAK